MRFRRGLVGALVVVTAVSCGISPEDEAVTRRPETVPFGLLESATTTTSTSTTVPSVDVTTTRPADRVTRIIYLWAGEGLVAVEREMSPGAGLSDAINALAVGPTAEETEAGLATLMTEISVVRGVSTARGTATVDLDRSFVESGSLAQTATLAQLVFSLTAWPGVGRVGFTLEGGPVEVPRGDGTLTTEPLTRDDFPDLDAGASP